MARQMRAPNGYWIRLTRDGYACGRRGSNHAVDYFATDVGAFQKAQELEWIDKHAHDCDFMQCKNPCNNLRSIYGNTHHMTDKNGKCLCHSNCNKAAVRTAPARKAKRTNAKEQGR